MYLIGDVQGCDSALQRLLAEIAFSPSRDTLFLLGDLVNRGPDSAGVLRRLMAFGDSAQCLLGNHDLHLLAVANGVRKAGRSDTLDGVLHAPDRAKMLGWLCQQRLAIHRNVAGKDYLMVHAGVLPQWTAGQTMRLAAEVESVLRGPALNDFLHQMYGNEPTQWHDDLAGAPRLRCIINALTRIRFCTPRGQMEFDAKGLTVDAAPAGYLPWFDTPDRRTANTIVAFGHWSTLGWLDRPDLLSLDSGCVWGGSLSALRLAGTADATGDTQQQKLIQVTCEAAQKPGT
jgi:bis(5'-nucleosyl)-tetraphosphatase (symmetrical)